MLPTARNSNFHRDLGLNRVIVRSRGEKMATSRLQMEGDDSVHLHITHSNLKSFSADARFSPQVSLV